MKSNTAFPKQLGDRREKLGGDEKLLWDTLKWHHWEEKRSHMHTDNNTLILSSYISHHDTDLTNFLKAFVGCLEDTARRTLSLYKWDAGARSLGYVATERLGWSSSSCILSETSLLAGGISSREGRGPITVTQCCWANGYSHGMAALREPGIWLQIYCVATDTATADLELLWWGK